MSQQFKKGQTVTLKTGCGYWDVTYSPIGGYFKRAGQEGLTFKIMEFLKGPSKIKGITADGTKIVCNEQYLAEWVNPNN